MEGGAKEKSQHEGPQQNQWREEPGTRPTEVTHKAWRVKVEPQSPEMEVDQGRAGGTEVRGGARGVEGRGAAGDGSEGQDTLLVSICLFMMNRLLYSSPVSCFG